jgi:Lysophospholipase
MTMTGMPAKHFMIDDAIPAILWGNSFGRLFIAVHGDMSNKADDVIVLLAKALTARGGGVLSFDLPEHGDRKGSPYPCTPWNCVADLQAALNHARKISDNVGVFACSMGAYFSLLAYADEPLAQCLFLSPVVDMERLITNMMQWFGVTESRLEAEREIPTPIGKTLSWEYYQYVKTHPVTAWNHKTSVLYGGKDTVCERDAVSGFCARFGCDLTEMEDGEHYFHTEGQLAFYRDWLRENLAL